MADNQETAFFWSVAAPFLAHESIEKGTMMGFPCLRFAGTFFASADHRTGDLVVKLPAPRVQELIAEGTGQPFAPAGRTFREWVLIAERDAGMWEEMINEAQKFVSK